MLLVFFLQLLIKKPQKTQLRSAKHKTQITSVSDPSFFLKCIEISLPNARYFLLICKSSRLRLSWITSAQEWCLLALHWLNLFFFLFFFPFQINNVKPWAQVKSAGNLFLVLVNLVSQFQFKVQRFVQTSWSRGQVQMAALCSSFLPIWQNFTARMIAFHPPLLHAQPTPGS